jgi:hypothetical protein
MRVARIVVLIAIGVSCHTSSPLSARGAYADGAHPAEAAFRSAVDAWAFDAYWRLWDMGTARTRQVLPRQDFTDRMRRGNAAPDAGGQVEVLAVSSESSTIVIVQASFVVRDTRRGWREMVRRPFLLTFEDGAWRINLWDFVGLVSYFPPDVVPVPPARVPHGPRS